MVIAFKSLFFADDKSLIEDLAQTPFVQKRTVSLPLAGDVDIWVVQNEPFPPDDDVVDIIKDSARVGEQFVGAPFPKTFIIVLLVVGDGNGTYTTTGSYRWNSMTLLRGWNGKVWGIPRGIAYYYFTSGIGPHWLSAGGAGFLESYFNDHKGLERLADRSDWLMNEALPCTVGGENVTVREHTPPE